MPLPLLPVALGIGTLLGAKKCYEGYNDRQKAKRINEDVKKRYDAAVAMRDRSIKTTNALLEELGEVKFAIYEKGSLASLCSLLATAEEASVRRLFAQADKKEEGASSSLKARLQKIWDIRTKLLDLAGTSTGANERAAFFGPLGAWGAADTCAYSGKHLAVAVTAGAVAKGAVLTWLIAHGSMAAGAFMFGGMIVAPAVFLGGVIFAFQGKRVLQNALANKSKIEEVEASISAISAQHDQVRHMGARLIDILGRFDAVLGARVQNLSALLKAGESTGAYGTSAVDALCACCELCESFQMLLDVRLMDDRFNALPEAEAILQQAEAFLSPKEEG